MIHVTSQNFHAVILIWDEKWLFLFYNLQLLTLTFFFLQPPNFKCAVLNKLWLQVLVNLAKYTPLLHTYYKLLPKLISKMIFITINIYVIVKSEYFAMNFFTYLQTPFNNTICYYISLHAHAVFELQKMLELFAKTHHFWR